MGSLIHGNYLESNNIHIYYLFYIKFYIRKINLFKIVENISLYISKKIIMESMNYKPKECIVIFFYENR